MNLYNSCTKLINAVSRVPAVGDINTYIVNVVIKLGFSSLYTNLYTPTTRTLDTAIN